MLSLRFRPLSYDRRAGAEKAFVTFEQYGELAKPAQQNADYTACENETNRAIAEAKDSEKDLRRNARDSVRTRKIGNTAKYCRVSCETCKKIIPYVRKS